MDANEVGGCGVMGSCGVKRGVRLQPGAMGSRGHYYIGSDPLTLRLLTHANRLNKRKESEGVRNPLQMNSIVDYQGVIDNFYFWGFPCWVRGIAGRFRVRYFNQITHGARRPSRAFFQKNLSWFELALLRALRSRISQGDF